MAPLERIPVPWNQRWELLRERLLPLACFAATVVACAALWRYQSSVTPFALGEVHVESIVVRSPVDGELLSRGDDADATELELYDEVEAGTVVGRVKEGDASSSIVELVAPQSGRIASIVARPGQLVSKGEPVMTVTASTGEFIVCHVAQHGGPVPKAGIVVAIRQQAPGARWTAAKVAAVGPAIELAPSYHGPAASAGDRGLPVRIAMPQELHLQPGTLVEVRFPPAS
jgi:hypothetical protein